MCPKSPIVTPTMLHLCSRGTMSFTSLPVQHKNTVFYSAAYFIHDPLCMTHSINQLPTPGTKPEESGKHTMGNIISRFTATITDYFTGDNNVASKKRPKSESPQCQCKRSLTECVRIHGKQPSCLILVLLHNSECYLLNVFNCFFNSR